MDLSAEDKALLASNKKKRLERNRAKAERLPEFIEEHLSARPRRLTKQLLDYAKTHASGRPLSHLMVPVLFGLGGALVLWPIKDDLMSSDGSFGAIIFAAGFIGVPLLIVLYGIIQRLRELPQYKLILTEGEVVTADITHKEGGRVRRRKVSQTIVALNVKGQQVVKKTFDRELIVCFEQGPEVLLLWHADCPSIVIPVLHLAGELDPSFLLTAR